MTLKYQVLSKEGDIYGGERLPEAVITIRSNGQNHPLHFVGREVTCTKHPLRGRGVEGLVSLGGSVALPKCYTIQYTWNAILNGEVPVTDIQKKHALFKPSLFDERDDLRNLFEVVLTMGAKALAKATRQREEDVENWVFKYGLPRFEEVEAFFANNVKEDKYCDLEKWLILWSRGYLGIYDFFVDSKVALTGYGRDGGINSCWFNGLQEEAWGKKSVYVNFVREHGDLGLQVLEMLPLEMARQLAMRGASEEEVRLLNWAITAENKRLAGNRDMPGAAAIFNREYSQALSLNFLQKDIEAILEGARRMEKEARYTALNLTNNKVGMPYLFQPINIEGNDGDRHRLRYSTGRGLHCDEHPQCDYIHDFLEKDALLADEVAKIIKVELVANKGVVFPDNVSNIALRQDYYNLYYGSLVRKELWKGVDQLVMYGDIPLLPSVAVAYANAGLPVQVVREWTRRGLLGVAQINCGDELKRTAWGQGKEDREVHLINHLANFTRGARELIDAKRFAWWQEQNADLRGIQDEIATSNEGPEKWGKILREKSGYYYSSSEYNRRLSRGERGMEEWRGHLRRERKLLPTGPERAL